MSGPQTCSSLPVDWKVWIYDEGEQRPTAAQQSTQQSDFTHTETVVAVFNLFPSEEQESDVFDV